MKRLLFFLFLLAAALVPAHGQISVDLQIKRRIYLVYEPVIATVVLTNNSGREVVLSDTEDGGQWFRFQIIATDGRMVPPRDPNYELQPLRLGAGQTVKRSVNLNELYTLGDFGTYKVRASIYLADTGKYYGSRLDTIELTEGKVIWKQTAGVPEGQEGAGGERTFSLLTLQQDKGIMLYVRIEGGDGIVYGCYNLGRGIDGMPPEAKLDGGNNLWVLQLIGPKTYNLAHIGVNGAFLGQNVYVTPKKKPYLRKLENGTLQIVGAIRQEPQVTAQAGTTGTPVDAPKLSDRPPGFPK